MENEFYKTILENLDEFIFIKDSNNNIIYSNSNINFPNLKNNSIISFNSKYYRCKIKNISINNINYFLYKLNDISNEKELLKHMTTDYMTSLSNLRGLELNINKFNNKIYSIIMIDLDNFKQINDSYTHAAGDYILKEVSKIFLKNISDNDLAVRYAGDEFLIFLDKNINEGAIIAEKIKNEIENTTFVFNNIKIKITATMGIKQFNSIDNIDKIINKVDLLMYDGKKNGKNKITAA